MNRKPLMTLLLAAAALSAGCTKEEMTEVTEPAVFTGDTAYFVFKIMDVGSTSTRATSTIDNDGDLDGFEDGIGDGTGSGDVDEFYINDVYFYFYDSDGHFVTMASKKKPNGDWHNQADVDQFNVTWDTESILPLTGLEGTTIPNWVVTVINKPTYFEPPTKLEGFYLELSNLGATAEPDQFYKNSMKSFVMSTASYIYTDSDTRKDTDTEDVWSNTYTAADGNSYWFATPVYPEDFCLGTPVSDGNGGYEDEDGESIDPLDIYVERLAAKVIVQVDDGLQANGSGLYEVSASTYDADDGTSSEATYYVKLEGWTLNAVARKSNMMKTIRDYMTEWNDSYFYPDYWKADEDSDNFSKTWNSPKYHRSYWAESYNYGLGTEPDSSNGNYDENETNVPTSGTNIDDYLKYTSLLADNLTDIGSSYYAYCAENTNTTGKASDDEAIVHSNTSSALTSVLIKATVYSDAEGTTPCDLIRTEDGTLFEKEDYLSLALSKLGDTYYLDGDGESPVDTTYVGIVTSTDGYVSVKVKDDYEDDYFWPDLEDEDSKLSYDEFQALIDGKFNEGDGEYANGFHGGQMYYNVPIEHLNNVYDRTYVDSGTGTTKTRVLEANYGIVRNHVYKLTITELENLGRGIWDPKEVIVPQPDIDTRYLTCTIHVLGWKLEKQTVIL